MDTVLHTIFRTVLKILECNLTHYGVHVNTRTHSLTHKRNAIARILFQQSCVELQLFHIACDGKKTFTLQGADVEALSALSHGVIRCNKLLRTRLSCCCILCDQGHSRRLGTLGLYYLLYSVSHWWRGFFQEVRQSFAWRERLHSWECCFFWGDLDRDYWGFMESQTSVLSSRHEKVPRNPLPR